MSHGSRERESQLSAPQLRSVVEGVKDALVVTKLTGEVVLMNSAALRLFDVAERDVAGGGGFSLLDHLSGRFEVSTLGGVPVTDSRNPLMRALRGEAYEDMELLVKRKGEEEPRVFLLSGSRVETDPPLGVLTIRDDTDRWRAERRYRVAFESDPAPAVIARLDDTRILEANEGMAELTGIDPEVLRSRSLKDLKPLNQSEALEDVAERLLAGERVHKVKRLLLDGADSELPVLLSARAIEVEGQSCGLFTFIDISELETARRGWRKTQELLDATLTEHAEEKVAMARLATTDPLTGIANRRGLNGRLKDERARARRYDDTFSVLLLDLDHFKRINDTYGHEAGDRVLREVAQLLKEECREPDLAGRWGGEEFMMILPQVDLEGAKDVASRIRERIERTKFADGIDLTISIGVASLDLGDDSQGLFARADRALYDAKAGGRNRVEVALPGHRGS